MEQVTLDNEDLSNFVDGFGDDEGDSPTVQDAVNHTNKLAPEVAASHIEKAQDYDISPDDYGDLSDFLDEETNVLTANVGTVGDVTKDFTLQSKAHADLATPDLEKMSTIEKFFRNLKEDVVDSPIRDREINDITSELISNNGTLDEAKKARLDFLNDERIKASQNTFGREIGTVEEGLTSVARIGTDVGLTYWENKELLGAGTVLGAGLGAAVGAIIPMAGTTIIGAKLGAKLGAGLSTAGVMALDGYNQGTSQFYNELSYAKGADGKLAHPDLTHERKLRIARGVGFVTGAGDAITGGVLAKANKFLGRFSGKLNVSKIMSQSPELLARIEVLGNIAEGAIASGGSEAAQELSQIFSEELAKTDENENGFLNAVDSLQATLADPETLNRVAWAGTIGAVAGTGMTAVASIGNQGRLTEQYTKVQDYVKENEAVLKTQNNLMDIAQIAKETNMSKVSPTQFEDFITKAADTIGINQEFFFNLEDLRNISNDPEKGAAVRHAIEGVNPEILRLAQEHGTNLSLPAADTIKLIMEYPDVANVIRTNSVGKSPVEVRAELKPTLEKLKAFEGHSDQFIQSISEGTELTPEARQSLADIADIGSTLGEVNNREDYLSQSMITPVEGVIEGKQVDTFNRDYTKARAELDQALVDDVNVRVDKERDVAFQTETDIEIAGELSAMERELAIINSYSNPSDNLLQYGVEDPQWVKEGYSLDLKTLNDEDWVITARDKDGNQVGEYEFSSSIDGLNDEQIASMSPSTDEAHRRKGLASSAYDMIEEKTGKKIRPDSALTEGGKALVKSRNRKKASGKGLLEHKKKGYSPFAIDPNSLSEAQRAIYLGDDKSNVIHKNMKSRKAFVEGGMSIHEAAMIQGFENGDALLKVLSETPTVDQVKKRRKVDDFKNEQLKRRIQSDTEAERLTRIDSKFTEVAKLQYKELEIMASKTFRTVNGRIFKIAKRMSSFKQFRDDAKNTINSLRIAEIDPKMWESAERKSHNQAAKDFTSGNFQSAFDNKQKSLQALELRRHATLATERVKHSEAFWKRAKNKGYQETLRKAGLDKAFDALATMYGLNGKSTGAEVDISALIKYANDNAKINKEVPTIPEGLEQHQRSYKSLTPQQFEDVTNFAREMYHQARDANKYNKILKDVDALQTKERAAEIIESAAMSNPMFDEKKAVEKKDLTKTEEFAKTIRTFATTVETFKSNILVLDNYKFNGTFYNILQKPIDLARTAKRAAMREMRHHDTNVVKQFFGSFDEWKRIQETQIEVPEFANFPELMQGNQTISKVALYKMVANMGDPDGIRNLTNYKDADGNNISIDTIRRVIERELTPKDIAFVQEHFINRWKNFTDASKDLVKRTKGIEPDMVEAVPFTLHGKEYPGGYFPQDYQPMSLHEKARLEAERAEDNMSRLEGEDASVYAAMRASERTEQGRRNEARTGSKRPLNLDYGKIFDIDEEFLHDIHFREVGIDIFKLFSDPRNEQNMKSVLGQESYKLMHDFAKDIISKSSESNIGVFTAQDHVVKKAINNLNNQGAVKAIAYNVNSTLIQLDSLTNTLQRVNPKAGLYIANQAMKIGKDIGNLHKYFDEAAKINPDIAFEQDGIDSAVIKNNLEFLSNEKPLFKKFSKDKRSPYVKFKELNQNLVQAGFEPMRFMDKVNRTLVTLGVSEQFMNGQFPGYSKERVAKMTDAERFETMRKLVKQVSDNCLTDMSPEGRSPLEKNPNYSLFVRFFTDRRARLNTMIAQASKTKNAVKAKDYKAATNYVLATTLATTVTSAFTGFIKGGNDDESLYDKFADIEGIDDILDMSFDSAKYVATAPFKMFAESIPGIDAAMYSLSSAEDGRRPRPVSLLALGVMNDGVDFINGFSDTMEAMLDNDLSTRQRKNLVTNVGYAIGTATGTGFPSNAVNKLIDQMSDMSDSDYVRDVGLRMHDLTDKWLDKYGNDEDAKAINDYVKEVKQSIPLQTEKSLESIMPENLTSHIAEKMSGGLWSKVDPETGATGIYQFTEDQWQFISASNPDLGLTEDGRVSKDPSEQNRALDWSMKNSARTLIAFGLEVNEKSLLASHKFGVENAVLLLEAKPNDSIIKVLGAEEAVKPEFKDFRTVKDIDKYLSK